MLIDTIKQDHSNALKFNDGRDILATSLSTTFMSDILNLAKEDLREVTQNQIDANMLKNGRNMLEISLLTRLIADILNVAKTELREVTDADCNKILNKYINSLTYYKKLYEKAKHTKYVQDTLTEIDIINKYRPKKMTTDELEKTVSELFFKSGLEKKQTSVGFLMVLLKKNHEGLYDNEEALSIVRKVLI